MIMHTLYTMIRYKSSLYWKTSQDMQDMVTLYQLSEFTAILCIVEYDFNCSTYYVNVYI